MQERTNSPEEARASDRERRENSNTELPHPPGTCDEVSHEFGGTGIEPLDATTHDALLDAAPDAIIVIDTSGVIVLANAQSERLFGWPREELVGQSVEALVPEGLRPGHPEHRARDVANPHPPPTGTAMDLSARRKNGTEFPAEISLSAIETRRGVLTVASVRDATDRRRAEAKFRGLLEAAPDAIVGVGIDGRIALVNGQAERLFGFTRDEMIGQLVEMLVPNRVRGAHPNHREAYFARPVTRPMGAGMELAGRRKDGTEFPAEISLSAIETEEGLLVSAAIRDGTDRKQAAIISSSNDAIISQTLDGTITTWNPAAAHMYGYEASAVLGRHIELIIPPEHLDRVRVAMSRAALGDRTPEYETVRLHADGTPLDVAITVSPIFDSAGIVTGLSTIARDITERKRAADEHRALEERLSQSQRLESLGQLAGGIAHDFNNLLAVILNYSSFVAAEVGDNEAVRADVDQIRIAAERAAGLTRQLLIFGRGETIQPEILDLNTVVRDVQTLLARTIGEHVELIVETTPDLPAVRADRGQLEQILVNLAVNSRDAMPDGGILTIETTTVEIDRETSRLRPDLEPGQYVTLSVSDSGSGMSREVIAHAFEPFFTTKPRGEGTGLGLATVYGIVTEAGGSVVLYSEGELGTTVRVYLPAVDQPARPTRKPQTAVFARGGGETILVVEDEKAMREVALRILRSNGFKVLAAANAQEALSVLEEQGCDLLLTDVIMPQMSGRELVERVHERRPGLPVLYMSGYSQGVLGRQRALDDGVALIQKPFSAHDLLEKVRSVLAAHASGRAR